MTGQRVSDEQFAEWLRQRGESWNVGMLAFDAVAADLRAAREENQRLQQRIGAALSLCDKAVASQRPSSMGALVAGDVPALTPNEIRAALGGGSSD